MKPEELKARNFQLQLKDKCDRVQIKRVWHYVLKIEMLKIYHQTEFDE
jgi:hypothetical protein